jgi:hypothetical protein
MEEAIRKRRFPMINMGDNAEVSYVFRIPLEPLSNQDKGGSDLRKGNSLH